VPEKGKDLTAEHSEVDTFDTLEPIIVGLHQVEDFEYLIIWLLPEQLSGWRLQAVPWHILSLKVLTREVLKIVPYLSGAARFCNYLKRVV
jgi:hypothetical protein